MKITDIRVVSRGFPRDFPLVEVDTDAGITGIGATASWTRPVSALLDSSPELPGPEPPFRGLLLGADPTRPAELWRRLFDGGWFGRGDEGGIAVNALAAVDIALWDIAGKAAGLPVHRLVGDVVQNQIMVYASTSAFPHDYDPEAPRRRTAREMIAECVTYRERGFKAVKLGWGNHFSEDDEETLAAIREGIGPEMLLMLDFGCPAYLDPGHTVDDAVRAAEVAARYGVHFLEEALRPRDADGFAGLTRRSPVRIATGESLALTADFQDFIDRRAAHILQPDAQQIGITQFVEVARRIEEAGMLCIPHCPWSPIAVAAHLQVLCTTSCGVMIEYPALAFAPPGSFRHTWLDTVHHRMIEHPLAVEDGHLQLPEGPGLGLGGFVPEVIAGMARMKPGG